MISDKGCGLEAPSDHIPASQVNVNRIQGREKQRQVLFENRNPSPCWDFKHSSGKPKSCAHDVISGAKSEASCLDGYGLKFHEDITMARGYPESANDEPKMLLQPDTRPISHEQLCIEVKGIYAGLVMVEAKCIDVDQKQSDAAARGTSSNERPILANDQWQSVIALHKQVRGLLFSSIPSLGLLKILAKFALAIATP